MRLLLAVGCDAYAHLSQLRGAERDAKTFYDALIRADIGEYDASKSFFLLSPSLSTIRQALQEILFDARAEVDTFTFLFAGHGGVKSGAYYLCAADSRPDMLSTTAFAMSSLFAILNEAQPRQSNIILDTCQGGGVVADLPTIIKPEIIGGSETPGISIFVSSAADQYSVEGSEGGLGSIHLMRCIDGTAIVQTTRPTMDLLEVGRVASSHMARQYPGQTPLLWGLNLYGEARFCKNPHYGGMTPPLAALPQIAAGSTAYSLIRENADRVWREYFSVVDDFQPRRLVDMVVTVVSAISSEGAEAAAFSRGLADAFALRAVASVDVFRRVEVVAACISSLLEQSEEDRVGGTMLDMAAQTLALNGRAIEETFEMLNANEYALLSERGGFGDLFYLPLRLCRVLGWVGTQHYISKWTDAPEGTFNDSLVRQLLQQVFATYSSSFVAVSDVQTPWLLTFLSCCHERGWNDDAEVVLGHMFNSFVTHGGNIASPSMDKGRVFEFLNRRLEGNYGDAFDRLSHPGEMLSVLLTGAGWFGLDDVIDPHLHLLDHYSFNVFIPQDHRDFAKSTVRDGVNHTYEIGGGIWRTGDFNLKWPEDCLSQIRADSAVNAASVRVGALLAAMLFPDRSPWFVATGQ
jgi:hypothetical protein